MRCFKRGLWVAAAAGVLGIARVAGAATVVVSPTSPNGWDISNVEGVGFTEMVPPSAPTPSGTDGDFASGPGAPPLGTGSFHQVVGTDGNDGTRVRTSALAGTPLTALTDVSYSTYVAANLGGQATYIQLRIDLDGNGSTDDVLFFEPVYQNGTYSMLPYSPGAVPNQCIGNPACVSLGVWQTWDADAGGWWSGNDSAGGPPLTTLGNYAANYPGAAIASDVPSVRLTSGFGAGAWDSFDGNVDAFAIAGTTYDFELVGPCSPGPLYVETTGSDAGNDCSVLATPCLTIQYAIDAACSGATILVGAGTYVETVTAGHGGVTPGSPGIDIDKPLTLSSVSGAALTTIQANGGHCLPTSCPGGPQQAVTLSASAITIDGFTVLETDPTVNVITADGAAASKNHTIQNNVIQNPTFDDGNTGGGWGILLGYGDADGNTIRGNEIHLNPDLTKNQFTFGIYFQGGSSDGNVVDDNLISHTGIGVIIDTGDTGAQVTNNRIKDNARGGIVDFGATGTVIGTNLLTNNGRAGVEIRNGATGAVVEDNCFDGNGASPPTFSPCPFGGCVVTPFGGIRIDDDGSPGATTGTQIQNNNFFGNNAPNGVTDSSAASTSTDGAAENNWWGCPTGANTGACDTTTANVDATPFLAAPASGTACAGCTADAQCDNGLVCDGPETCNTGSGMCEAGTAPTCGLGGADPQCNVAVCTEPTGCGVQVQPNGFPCTADTDTCSIADTCQSAVCTDGGGGDPDNDNLCSADDNCPADSNPGQEDTNGDGEGDVCDSPDATGLSLRRAQVNKAPGMGRDSWSAQAEIDTTLTPNFLSAVDNGGLIVAINDNNGVPVGMLIDEETFTGPECTLAGGGNILRCKNALGSQVRFSKRISTGFFRVIISIRKQSLVLPLIADTPLHVTVTNPVSIDRVDSVGNCQLRAKRVICIELP